jgi:hypothetical protein
LRLLQQLRPALLVDGAAGRVAPVDAEKAMHTAFLILFLWTGVRRAERVVFGARFAFYPNVVQLPDGRPALDVAGAVREDTNAIDALCRLALAQYDAWQQQPGTTLRVFVDGEPREVDANGAFDARGDVAMARDEYNCTRMRAGDLLPFRDDRLS